MASPCTAGLKGCCAMQWLPHIEQRAENNTAKPPK